MSAPAGIRLLRWTVLLAVAAAVVGGLTVSGPPRQERRRQLDQRRQNDLSQLADRIDRHWNRTGALPPTLAALVEAGDRFAEPIPSDPATQSAYDYAVEDTLHYRLCATFETDSQELARRQAQPDYDGANHFWDHPTGRHCFLIRVRRLDSDPVRPTP
jgi:hypothetical protein